MTSPAPPRSTLRYPAQPPDRLFPWLRETIAHRALDHLRAELPEIEIRCEPEFRSS